MIERLIHKIMVIDGSILNCQYVTAFEDIIEKINEILDVINEGDQQVLTKEDIFGTWEDISQNLARNLGTTISNAIEEACQNKEHAEELKSCPFCGEPPKIDSTGIKVICENYDCRMAQSSCFRTKEEAINAWNKRDE